MRLLLPTLVAALSVPTFFVSTNALATPVAKPLAKICGQPSGAGLKLMDESVNAATEMGAAALAAGLSTLQHFPAVQNLVRAGDVVSVCSSGVVVDRNIYKNNLDLLVIEVEKQSGEKLVLPVLLQTASIQAYEGPGGRRPWIGFSRQDLAATIRQTIANSSLQEISAKGAEFDPLKLGAQFFSNEKAELDTRSYVHIPDVDPEWSTYLVTQLRLLGDSTSYASHVLLDAVIIQTNGHRARIGAANGFFAAYHNLLVRQSLSQPRDASIGSQVERLNQLAKSPVR